jgi:hypothetical protein
MPSTYSTSLKIELIGNGEQSGTWGQTTNNNLGTLIEQAITGVGQISLNDVSTYTLTSLNGLVDQSRNNVLVFSGDPGNSCVVTAPTVEKVYIVSNEVSNNYTITIKTAGGNGITILNGAKQLIYCDGTDFYTGVSVNSIFGNSNVTGNAFISNNVSVGGTITVNNSVTSSFANITMTANSSIISMLPNTGGFIVPTGTTAQRPSSPLAGMARWNTDVGAYEIWNGVNWENISAGTYSSTYLIIAGGGGGGIGVGAGGGAGGLLTGTYDLTPSTSYTITVGSGGAGGVRGSNSTALSLVSIGGGAGGNASTSSSGGSGGGSGGFGAGSGTAGQGFAGGASAGGTSGQTYGGGGGGAGAVGLGAVYNTRGGDGGIGVQSDITGTATYYAGGTGGTWQGIGGTAGTSGSGYLNYGGGGDSYEAGAGKNGAVIIRYAYPTQRGSGGNVTSYTSGTTKYWVHTFTTSGTFIA